MKLLLIILVVLIGVVLAQDDTAHSDYEEDDHDHDHDHDRDDDNGTDDHGAPAPPPPAEIRREVTKRVDLRAQPFSPRVAQSNCPCNNCDSPCGGSSCGGSSCNTPCTGIAPIPPTTEQRCHTKEPTPVDTTDHSSKFVAYNETETWECQIGMIKNGNICEDTLVADCPHGFKWNIDVCESEHTECPHNYDWIEGECTLRVVCPYTYTHRGDRCVPPPPPPPECPAGWRWNSQKEVCQTNADCRPGLILRGTKCVSIRYECPWGYIKRGNKCEKPIRECQRGAQFKNGRCWRVTKTCPKGSTPYGEECQITTTTGGKYFKCYPPYEMGDDDLCHHCVDEIIPGVPGIPCRSSCKSRSNCNSCNSCNSCNDCQNNGNCNDCNNNSPCTNCNVNERIQNGPNIRVFSHGAGNVVRRNGNLMRAANHRKRTITNLNITSTECAAGSIRTAVVQNNEIVNGCVEIKDGNLAADEKNCCEIIGPRECKKVTKGRQQWSCSHKRFKYCGGFCVDDQVHLRPTETIFYDNVLTIAPAESQGVPCAGKNCIDCSGCIDGSLKCSSQCFTYPCTKKGCTFLNQNDFCETVGGIACSSPQ